MTARLDQWLTDSGRALRTLDGDHLAMDFDCGRESGLSTWICAYGTKWQDEDLCRVWVVSPLDNHTRVDGYFTLSAHQVTHKDIGRKSKAVNPDNNSWVGGVATAPAQLLGKFAVDINHQGTGLAGLLMACVYAKHVEAADSVGAKYLVTEVREPALQTYYSKQYGFVASSRPGDLVQMFRPTSGIRGDLIELGLS